MTDDEEKQLKQALLAVEFSLRRKQEFWETPRNIAILVGVTAAIAAAIGFWLGHASTPPPAPNIRPVTLTGSDDMTADQFIDAVQTAGIIMIALALIYVVVRLERALTAIAKKIKPAIKRQQAIESAVEHALRRVEALERQAAERDAPS